MAKAKRRKAVPVHKHESYRKKGRLRCKHCGGNHTASQHWSHRASEAKKSYKTDPKRKHAPGDFRAGQRRVKSGMSKKSKRTATGKLTRAERSALNKARHAKIHNVRAHLAKNPGRKPGSHRVKAHKAKNPRGRKR